MTTHIRRGAALCALLGTTCLAPHSLGAASGTIAPPPEKFAISPGGVDMRSGRYVYNQTDLSIGPEAGGLSLVRSMVQQVAGHNNPFGNFSHNWDVLLTEKRINIFDNLFKHTPGQPDYQIEINFGGRSQTFRAAGSTSGFEQISRSGYAQLNVAGNRAGTAAVYTFKTSDGATVTFRPIGSADCSSVLRCAYVSQVEEADGTRLDFSYDKLGGANTSQLRSVTSSRGYALVLEYNGAAVSRACLLNLAVTAKPASNSCPSNALVTSSYAYSGSKLANVVDASGDTWSFVNASNSIGFVKPGQTSPWLTNNFFERMNNDGLMEEIVGSQQFADGSSYSYEFAQTPFVAGEIPQLAGGMFTDAQGKITTLQYEFPVKPYDPGQGYGDVPGEDTPDETSPMVYQVTPGPITVTDPLGRTTKTDYCDPNAMANLPSNWRFRCLVTPVPVSVTDPEGITTYLTWDMFTRTLMKSRQVAKSGSGLPESIRSATYNCSPQNFRSCSKPVSATDARSAVTTYAYAPEHGGLLVETAPAVNGVQPQTRNAYTQRYAWIRNDAGGYSPASTAVWVLESTSSCRTSAATGNPSAPCATPGDEVRTTYDYGPNSGPNNLLVRGVVVTADGKSLRTCRSYDALGRMVSETKPGANLTSCP